MIWHPCGQRGNIEQRCENRDCDEFHFWNFAGVRLEFLWGFDDLTGGLELLFLENCDIYNLIHSEYKLS